jgi:hypothetical protein
LVSSGENITNEKHEYIRIDAEMQSYDTSRTSFSNIKTSRGNIILDAL